MRPTRTRTTTALAGFVLGVAVATTSGAASAMPQPAGQHPATSSADKADARPDSIDWPSFHPPYLRRAGGGLW